MSALYRRTRFCSQQKSERTPERRRIVIIESPALSTMRANKYVGPQIARLFVESQDIELPLEPNTKAVEKRLVEKGDIGTLSEDFTSFFNVGPDSSDSLEEEIILFI